MEWREYDEEGKCKICKRKISTEKIKKQNFSYKEHESTFQTIETEEENYED